MILSAANNVFVKLESAAGFIGCINFLCLWWLCEKQTSGMVSIVADDPYSVIENPAKFGLALLTIVFDVLFMCQHYVLYNEKRVVEYDDTEETGSKEAFIKNVWRDIFST